MSPRLPLWWILCSWALLSFACSKGGSSKLAAILPPAQDLDRISTRYIAARLDRTTAARSSASTTITVDNVAGTWTGTRTATSGNDSPAGTYTMDVNGDGGLVETGGQTLMIYTPTDGSAIIGAQVANKDVQSIIVAVKSTATNFAANDGSLSGRTLNYALFTTTAAGASASSLGTITFTGTSATAGTWAGTQSRAKNVAAATLTGGGNYTVSAVGAFSITIGGTAFTGGIQDGYAMLVAARTAGDPGMVVLCDRAAGVSATGYHGKTLRGVFFEDGVSLDNGNQILTSCGITTETISATSATTGTSTGSGQGTAAIPGATQTFSGSGSNAFSGFGNDGSYLSEDDADPATVSDEQLRFIINTTGSRSLNIDAEDIAGSTPEIGVSLGN